MNTENHQKVSYKEGKEWDFCIKFDCDGCVFRDNISEILFNLLNNPDDIKTVYYNISKSFVLLHSYVGFGQEKDYLFFLLPGKATCQCSWGDDYI